MPASLCIRDKERQRLQSKPATICDSTPPQIPTEVHHESCPLGGRAQVLPVAEPRMLPEERQVDARKRLIKRADRRAGNDLFR
jgi:hypothetical protein